MHAAVESVLRPVDWVRVRALQSLGPLGGKLAADRDLRVAVAGTAGAILALSLATGAPMWLLALGPIVLGIPHVLADVRYLVVRRGFHERRLLVIFAFGPLVAVVLGAGLLGGLVAALGAIAVSRTTPVKRVAGIAVVLALMGVVYHYGYYADVVFAHVHNGIAIVLWWFWRRRPASHLVPLLAILAGGAFLLFGGADPILAATGGLIAPGTGLDIYRLSFGLAPEMPMVWAARLIVFFAFAQSIHYLVWLRLVPDEDRGRTTVRTFRASYRALIADLGRPLLVLALFAAVGLAIYATVDLAEAREGYLNVALFHGDLELVALALFFCEGRPREAGSQA
jgi:hypothetical protein